MGPQQISLLNLFHRKLSREASSRYSLGDLLSSSEVALIDPSPANGLVTDSACAASQLASGQEALIGTLGLDAQGLAVPSILELAQQSGKSVGLVSDTRLTHATPASFAVHVASRELENLIAEKLIESRAHVMFSGGLRHFVPQSEAHGYTFPFYVSSKRTDQLNLLAKAESEGYRLIFDRTELQQNKFLSSDRLLGLFAESAMLDGISARALENDSDRLQPSLLEMSQVAVEHLNQNPKGFFLMIEAGQIDWAGHANDAGWLLAEMQKLDQTLAFLNDWTQSHSDTLLIVTADHETGSFGISYSAHKIPPGQIIDSPIFNDQLAGQYIPSLNFGKTEQLELISRQQTKLPDIFEAYQDLSFFRRNHRSFQKIVQSVTGISLSFEQTNRIFRVSSNHFYVPGHEELGFRYAPAVGPYEAFYPYAPYALTALLARELAGEQGVVWGSGTHTATPVLAISRGPGMRNFRGFMHATELGKRMIKNFIPLSVLKYAQQSSTG